MIMIMWGPNIDINFNDNDGDDDNDGFVVDDPPICVAGIITIPLNIMIPICVAGIIGVVLSFPAHILSSGQ